MSSYEALLGEVRSVFASSQSLSLAQARSLALLPDEYIVPLTQVANEVRRRFCGDKIDLCSIINARSGGCPEDCKFCAQSARYSRARAGAMRSVAEMVAAAKKAEENGSHRFCIVTSGARLNDRDFAIALDAVGRIKSETGLKRCASLGLLSQTRARLLREAGLNRFHHNLETARSFFSMICTTHTYEERMQTIEHLREADIERCVGGIINLGETDVQRIDFAFEIASCEPKSVPINFLNPRPNTPLADRPLMSATEAVKYLAIFRLILPETNIRLAGGRTGTFTARPELPFTAGVNGLLIGDLLTTRGPSTQSDLRLLSALGFQIEHDAQA